MKTTKITTTAGRLKEIMEKRGLKQADIIELTRPFTSQCEAKITRSDLSQYVSGKTRPSQKKLYLLALALNVNEPWLIGYDLPSMRNNDISSLTSFKDNPAVATAINTDSPIAAELIQLHLEASLSISNLEHELIFAFREADIMTQRNIFRILGLDEKKLSSESSEAV